MRYVGLLLLLCAAGCAPVGDVVTESAAPKRLMVWDDLLSRPKPVADATVSYGADALQVVDVWKPAGAGPHPAVVMIHGGCWQTKIAERDIMNWIADDLRKHGVGVWNIEYRGVDRGGGYPGTYQDVGAAADMFAAKRAEFGFKTDAPVVTIGHSAGGHLSLWLARRSELAKGDARTTAEMQESFAPLAAEFSIKARFHEAARPVPTVIMVSQHGHCLHDLLFRVRSGLLEREINACLFAQDLGGFVGA